MGIFSKFFGALKKTKDAISKKISQIFAQFQCGKSERERESEKERGASISI